MSINNEALKVIAGRASVRNYQDKPIERETLTALVKVGMCAPSARNIQPWRFLVMTDKAKLAAMTKVLPAGQMLSQAAAAIVVAADAGDMDASKPGFDYWVQDCSAATQNILLAAKAMGIGSVWLGVHPIVDRTANLKRLLGLPENILPLGVVSLGYPASDEPPKDKYVAGKVHWETW